MPPLPPSTTSTTTYHPSPRNVRRGQEDKGTCKKSQQERSVSFHGRTTVRLYVKEERCPPLPTTDPSALGLHYSQFSLECLDPKEKLIGLGSRNFFLCPKPVPGAGAGAAAAAKPPTYFFFSFDNFIEGVLGQLNDM